MTKIIGYKAFNKDMTCNGFQYEEGKTYEIDTAKICEKGFHFCENPLDCWSYYNMLDSVIHEVVSTGTVDRSKDDSKIATTKITIGKRLSLSEIVERSYIFLNKNGEASSGDYSSQASSGYSSSQASSGNYSRQASSGNYSRHDMQGKHSVAVSSGHESIARGKKGCWVALTEWKYDDKEGCSIPVCVKAGKIDGKKLKEDTWYMLKGGKFVKCREEK